MLHFDATLRGVELERVTPADLNIIEDGVTVAAFDLKTTGLERFSEILQVTSSVAECPANLFAN